MNISEIVVREITALSEMKALEELQREVWGLADLEILPAEHFLVTHETGGPLIGAYDHTELIGFVYGTPAHERGQLSIHSGMCAVRRQYRDHHLGYRLKLAQRDWAIKRGISLVTWTFDPLQARNAQLNFAKLGVVSEQYKINFYGETSSFLHQLGTDRLWVRWRLNSERVEERLAAKSAAHTLPDDYQIASALVQCDARLHPHRNEITPGEKVFIEIPGDINALQSANRAQAVRWREVTRSAFTELITKGYCVENFYRCQRKDQLVGVYELRTGERH